MGFTTDFLKEIGIRPTSVPEGLVIKFTDANRNNLQIGNKTISIKTGHTYENQHEHSAKLSQAEQLDLIKSNIASLLIDKGARKLEV